MTRDQIQQRITELDRQINSELGKTRLPSLNTRYATFPTKSWVSAIVLAALWYMGPQFLPMLNDFKFYIFVAAVLVILFSLFATVMFLKGKMGKTDRGYTQATAHVKELQAERQELQRKLKELNS